MKVFSLHPTLGSPAILFNVRHVANIRLGGRCPVCPRDSRHGIEAGTRRIQVEYEDGGVGRQVQKQRHVLALGNTL